MVFGFGKKKVSEQPITQSNVKIVAFPDIPKFLQELESPKRTELVDQAKTIRVKVLSNMKDIHEIILQLEEDDLKLSDVDKNLRTVASRGKDSVVSTIKRETSSSLINITKYEDALSLNTQINQILKRMGDTLGLNSRIIHIFARKYADNLKEEITKMAANRNSLQTVINSYEDFKTSYRTQEETKNKIIDLKKEIAQNNLRIAEIDSEMNSTQNTITRLDKEIFDLKSMKEYQIFLEIKNKINLLSSEKYEIKNKIDMQFSKISRPLSKYSYISSFEKPVKRVMEELIREPYEAISLQNKDTIIEVLRAVEKSVLSGSISVKDTEKSLEQIEETISLLDEFLAMKETYSNRVIKLEGELTIFDTKLLKSKENDLEKEKNNLINL
ncbi:MAG TPA: hypothetical protein VET47_00020, partial [Candidatus Limnocylindrales bacterium]|nr:hypothetical protein [Candidatus Limnocylindrales bacterium]